MPTRGPRVCSRPGCREVAATGRYCTDCTTVVQTQSDERRGTAASRGYGRRWRRESKAYLAEHPLCARHQRAGKVRAASLVDHVRPHRGDMALFWDKDNWESLCKTCHDHKTATEDGGFGRRR